MITAVFDDSGTDPGSEIAIAACYVSTRRCWEMFVDEWNQTRRDEDFDDFHMAEFVAPNKYGHKPYCDWDNVKKDRIFDRLASIINRNKRIGIAAAVPKHVYDQVPDRFRAHFGREHYTFAVRMCMSRIIEWRERSNISLPVQYVFDWEMNVSPKRKELQTVFDVLTKHESLAAQFGVEPAGMSFQHRREFRPLHAADILAWQMRNHMRKIFPLSEDRAELCHPGFRKLRENQEMDLGFFTEDQIQKFVKLQEQSEAMYGPPEVLYP